MAKPAVRIAALQVLLGLGALAVVGRSTVLQVFEHSAWRKRAEERSTRTRDIVPRRGTIYDRTGTPLAVTYEAYHIRVAVKQLRDTVAAQELLQRTLAIPMADLRRKFNRADIYFDGPYDATRVQPLRGVRGIYLDPIRLRERPMGELAAALVGHTDRTSGRGLGGIEAIYDSALVGRTGREQYVLDGAGRRVPLPRATQVEARAGNDIILTLDHELQGIAEGALRRAVAEFGARGGDVVMLETATGRVRAAVSLRTPPGSNRMVSNTAAIIETNEPGSTAKIFTAAAMHVSHADTTPVDGEGGLWRQQMGRAVREHRDVHRVSGLLTLGEAIQHSSNIAMAKFSLRLPTEQHYLTLRRFGFGTPTGLGFPGEDGGQLRRPAALANPLFTKPSWAQGYEMNVSSVQMAAAYAALANGGMLLAPALIEEIRDPVTGEAIWRHHPDTLRRAVDADVAASMMAYLRMASDSGGTGARAQLDREAVLGKTGTAKVLVNGSYNSGFYRASFAGLYPGSAPRYVIYVMIDRPSIGSYYGGVVAAPIVRSMLQQALALRSAPLEPERRAAVLADPPAPMAVAEPVGPPRLAAFPLTGPMPESDRPREVPAVVGTDLREALHLMHRNGFTVRVVGRGTVRETRPAAGSAAAAGERVTLVAREDRR